MDDLKVLLIFVILFGLMALYRERIKMSIEENRENFDGVYIPKKFYMRGTGINENGHNVNYEGDFKNSSPYKWNTDNNVEEQTKMLNKHKSHDAIYIQKLGYSKYDKGGAHPFARNEDFMKNVTNGLLDF
mgnify:FL=1